MSIAVSDYLKLSNLKQTFIISVSVGQEFGSVFWVVLAPGLEASVVPARAAVIGRLDESYANSPTAVQRRPWFLLMWAAS